jgi:SNF2 family DNA or RNA helicase
MRCHRKTIYVRSTPHANSPSPEFALDIAPLIHSAGLAWVVAQCHGEIPRVPEFQHQVPAYRRVAMRGGLIGDDMGIGKTIQTLGFITWMSENYASLGAGTPIPPHQNIQPEGEGEFRPSLVITSTSVAYQWVEETEEFWKGLKVYLYHGRNDGHLGAKYKHLRILAEELKGYAGSATKDSIRADLKPLFDKKNRGNLGVVVVAAYDAFRERAKLVEQDEDEIELISFVSLLWWYLFPSLL